MAIQTLKDWENFFTEFRTSGLLKADFAKAKGVTTSQWNYGRSLLTREIQRAKKEEDHKRRQEEEARRNERNARLIYLLVTVDVRSLMAPEKTVVKEYYIAKIDPLEIKESEYASVIRESLDHFSIGLLPEHQAIPVPIASVSWMDIYVGQLVSVLQENDRTEPNYNYYGGCIIDYDGFQLEESGNFGQRLKSLYRISKLPTKRT